MRWVSPDIQRTHLYQASLTFTCSSHPLLRYREHLKENYLDTQACVLIKHSNQMLQVTCDADPYREFMPFEPSFLVTVLCSDSGLCPKPLTCLNKSQSSPHEMCQSRTLHWIWEDLLELVWDYWTIGAAQCLVKIGESQSRDH